MIITPEHERACQDEWRDVRLAEFFTFRDGMAVRMRAFADRQDALRWVELEA
jgi:hypothetical protein